MSVNQYTDFLRTDLGGYVGVNLSRVDSWVPSGREGEHTIVEVGYQTYEITTPYEEFTKIIRKYWSVTTL